ncbi:exopolysaccharide biosynthesis polyprenyl glycosylphosphotransferase [Acetobacter musti]|uniref:Exopolysaccharide biosynthesis polyprenyl glycosylphosphotransferase n=2 Tax=Acetobacter musti TaxID=864732 RepID=A0ABX0JRK3_9PROT|nr:exopolysaccharide biosynthesis polyprenyl glycosylphosphotransferase [Acetobacter musti]
MLAAIVTWLDRLSLVVGSLIVDVFKLQRVPSDAVPVIVVGSAVAVLVFWLFPKKRNLLSFPKIRRIKAQFRYLSLSLFSSAFACFFIELIFFRSMEFSFEFSLTWLVVTIGVLFIERLFVTFILYQPAIVSRLQRKIAIVGFGEEASQLAERISCDAGHTYGLYGVYNDPNEMHLNNNFSGGIDDLIARSRRDPLHAIIFAFPRVDEGDEFLKCISLKLRQVLSDIYIIPSLVDGVDVSMPVEYLGDSALFVLQRRPLSDFQIFQKSCVDFVLALFGIVFLFPFFVLVGIAIKIDSRGPIFFKQPRLGKNGREFFVYKFRSMYAHMSDAMADRQTSRGDPRVTRIGKWLRKLSIDEIPQLFNVIQGDMSLVGPRPHAPHTRAGGKLLDDALAEYVLRYHVKPGITGWAQVNGARGELVTLEDLKKRVSYDLDYIRRWSLILDFKIMFLTIVKEVFSRHAF